MRLGTVPSCQKLRNTSVLHIHSIYWEEGEHLGKPVTFFFFFLFLFHGSCINSLKYLGREDSLRYIQ